MLYLIGLTKNCEGNRLRYDLFDTHTHSVFTMDDYNIMSTINHGVEIANVEIKENKVEMKWNKELKKEILVVSISDDGWFKMVDNGGNVSYADYDRIEQYTKAELVANTIMENEKVVSFDTYEDKSDTQFETTIQEKYKQYVSKSKILGKDYSFDYEIENHEVKIKRYTGKSKDVMIPGFVTTIMYGAFANTGIESIKMNDGLKYIGSVAFNMCNLSELTIPETVEFTGATIFRGNKNLFEHGAYSDRKLKYLSRNTITFR